MHILLLSIAYPPEIRSASTLTRDFAVQLRRLGHEVTVVTGYPRYNLSEDERDRMYPTVAVGDDGIRVVRIRTLPVHRVSPAVRGISELSLPFVFAVAAARYVHRKVDIVEVYSPPLTLGLAGTIARWFFRASLIVNIQDLFPQNAVDLGMLRSGPVLSFLLAVERLVYRFADVITVHSPGNRRFLVGHRGVPESKVVTIPNWVDIESFDAVRDGVGADPDPLFREMDVGARKVFLFAGVMGPAQGLDVVVEAAEMLADQTDVLFLLLGDGTDRARLEGLVRAAGLNNVRFGEFVPPERYTGIVTHCYAGLVTLTPFYRTPVVPGKLMGYMAAGIPVVAALNAESDGHDIVAKSGGGVAVQAGDAKGLAAAVRRLAEDPLRQKEMGQAGLRYARSQFATETCVGMYDALFRELTQGK